MSAHPADTARQPTVLQVLRALERYLELEGVEKRRGVVQHGHVRHLNLRHPTQPGKFPRCRCLPRMRPCGQKLQNKALVT